MTTPTMPVREPLSTSPKSSSAHRATVAAALERADSPSQTVATIDQSSSVLR